MTKFHLLAAALLITFSTYSHADHSAELNIDYESLKYSELKSLAEDGDHDAQYYMGDIYYYGDGQEKDYEKAKEWYLLSANQGDAVSQNTLGYMYFHGLGVKKDYQEAFNWHLMAANQGIVESQLEIGRMYSRGLGDEGLTLAENAKTGLKWYRLAAEQGSSLAQTILGLHYVMGDVVDRDYIEAIKWLKLAAEQGMMEAQLGLAQVYFHGEGVDKNYKEALKWSEKAARQGNSEAQLITGNIYQFHAEEAAVDSALNHAEAAKWYQLASDQGDFKATMLLATYYQAGYYQGIEQNYPKAIELYLRAAKTGDWKAQADLAMNYTLMDLDNINEGTSDGSPESYILSSVWSFVAKSQVDPFVDIYKYAAAVSGGEMTLHVSTSRTTPGETQVAQYLANQCIKSSYTQCPESLSVGDIERLQNVASETKNSNYNIMQHSQLRELVSDGDVEAQAYMGLHYLIGTGLQDNVDDALALKWLGLAARNGHEGALKLLEIAKPIKSTLDAGKVTDVNVIDILLSAKKSGVDSSAMAELNVAIQYVMGESVDKDISEAAKWYKLAAEKGLPEAQFGYGSLFLGTGGAPADYAVADKWIRLAAVQGQPVAQYRLAQMYYRGEGFERNNVLAYMWLSISDVVTDELDMLEKMATERYKDSFYSSVKAVNSAQDLSSEMTKQEVEDAKKMAQQCIVSSYADCPS